MTSLPDTYSTDLGQLGLEEVEPWQVEDSFENRRTLRLHHYQWRVVDDAEGMPSGLIRVFTQEELTKRRGTVWEQRRPIMEDPSNPWSEYISPLDYPPDADAPSWVRMRAKRWLEQREEGTDPEKREGLPSRCRITRNDGTRCWNWVSRKNVNRCRQHLTWGQNDAARVAVARARISQASLRSVEVLEELQDSAEGEAVRLKASTEILDRAGVRGGVEIDSNVRVEHTDASAEVRERLSRLSDRLDTERRRVRELEEPPPEDVVDGEIVDEDTSGASGPDRRDDSGVADSEGDAVGEVEVSRDDSQ